MKAVQNGRKRPGNTEQTSLAVSRDEKELRESGIRANATGSKPKSVLGPSFVKIRTRRSSSDALCPESDSVVLGRPPRGDARPDSTCVEKAPSASQSESERARVQTRTCSRRVIRHNSEDFTPQWWKIRSNSRTASQKWFSRKTEAKAQRCEHAQAAGAIFRQNTTGDGSILP